MKHMTGLVVAAVLVPGYSVTASLEKESNWRRRGWLSSKNVCTRST
jgi:hypothetical protein